MTAKVNQHPRGWRKSSYSNGSNGSCVEVAELSSGNVVPVRDSKDVCRGHIAIPSNAWAEFTDTIRL